MVARTSNEGATKLLLGLQVICGQRKIKIACMYILAQAKGCMP